MENIPPEYIKNTIDFIKYQQALEVIEWAWKLNRPFNLRDIVKKYKEKLSSDNIMEVIDTLMSKELINFVPNEESMKKDPNLVRLFEDDTNEDID